LKIEKINDNQIKCTLTRDDLADRQLKLSELAYGTEKAKNLFRDLMLQAQEEFGFEANNMPLMIEAIPTSAESIVLIVTKVDNPEELDSRFSKFAPLLDSDAAEDADEDSPASPFSDSLPGADDILELFQKLCDSKIKQISEKTETPGKTPDATAESNNEAEEGRQNTTEASSKKSKPVKLIRQFQFQTLDSVIEASKGLNGFYTGTNTLYKEKSQKYTLILHQENTVPEDFNRICNILSEYGTGKASSTSREAYLQEHAEIIIAKQALQQLLLLA